jgi:hypothetical protein
MHAMSALYTATSKLAQGDLTALPSDLGFGEVARMLSS